MAIPLLVVDAFADRPFSGNPAGVCLLASPREAGWMQSVAGEVNLPETAFLVRRGDAAFDLRWFTPTVEIDLCGHATLASAHVLWERDLVPADRTIEFATASGALLASRGPDGWIELDFPARRFEAVAPGSAEWSLVEEVAAAAGVAAVEGARHGKDWLLLAGSASEVRLARPDAAALAPLGDMVIVTAAAGGVGVDFVSRCFVPALGIPEDPVTGAAHCALGPFWQSRLKRSDMVGFQASARGGTVRVRVASDRVLLGGQAVTMIRGELTD